MSNVYKQAATIFFLGQSQIEVCTTLERLLKNVIAIKNNKIQCSKLVAKCKSTASPDSRIIYDDNKDQ